MDQFVAWLAPIAATLVTLAGQLWLNGRFKAADEKRDQARAETEAKRAAEAEWRRRIESSVADLKRDVMQSKDAQQSTMRQSLIHSYEKYVTRDWLTTEELSAWLDMHDKYSAMGFNGLIDTYRERIVQLEIRPLDELAKC
jgi:hypothetical protein